MPIRLSLAFALLGLPAVNIAYAEDIIIPIASQGAYLGSVKRPTLGEKSAQVIQQFGEPLLRHPATGTPAISRWDYADFSVYFEEGVVLHSVLKHRRADSVAPAAE